MTQHRFLFFTDPHFTDREQDAYRWKLFPFLHEVEKRFGHIDLLACLGDLTEHKDCHSSALAHRIRHELQSAPGAWKVILKGNHDYIEEGEPYFDWLGDLDRQHGNISYVSDSMLCDGGALFLPHTRNPVEAWKKWRQRDEEIRLVLTHITVDGCQSEMGQVLPGISRTSIPGTKALVLSGDIHKPQHMGPDFIYVGTPYSTRFSPVYEPRVLMLEFNDKDQLFNPVITSIPTGLKRKITLTVTMKEAEDYGLALVGLCTLTPEDEVRISVKIPSMLTPSQWQEFKREVMAGYSGDHISMIPLVERKQELQAPLDAGAITTPQEALSEYCTTSAVPEQLQAVGLGMLRRHLSTT